MFIRFLKLFIYFFLDVLAGKTCCILSTNKKFYTQKFSHVNIIDKGNAQVRKDSLRRIFNVLLANWGLKPFYKTRHEE
jgi:hypothetical protein